MTDKIYVLQQSDLWEGPYYLGVFSSNESAIKYLLKHKYIPEDREYEFRNSDDNEFALFYKDTGNVVGMKNSSFYDLHEAILDDMEEE